MNNFDRIILDKDSQRSLIEDGIKKYGSERNFSSITQIPKSSLYNYKTNKCTLPAYRFKKILINLNLKFEDLELYILKILPSNWGQKKGGKYCYKKRKIDGSFSKHLKVLKIASSIKNKERHDFMKKKSPLKYHLIQYNNFKKISGYKFKSKKGEKVRNILEKNVADYLFSQKIDYEYEPFITAGGKPYFPDFLIDRLIVEATMWRGTMKIKKLREKYINFKKEGFRFLVVVSPEVKKFYVNCGFPVIELSKLQDYIYLYSSKML